VKDLEIILTSDGSHTLRNVQLQETYHSIHGAVQESMHVFIKNGLEYFFLQHRPKRVSIFEVGFGTGLNALLAWQFAMQYKVAVEFTTVEPFPLSEDIWSQLNYAKEDITRERFMRLHHAAWNAPLPLSEEFVLEKRRNSLQEWDLARQYNVIFFDAFAPSIQPELWNFESLKKVIVALHAGGVFVTYSAKGQLKRDLKTLGLTVETLAGPPGKNEMVRGILSDEIPSL
jgi:tRNA U34 5-methylaminomethyl-2-thiouridine-forming methyltransferase MnmC